jgi:transcriptional activator of cad operon
MEPPATIKLRIGDWCVDPNSGQISREGEAVRVEARTMRLLLALAERPGEVVSIDDLLNHVWPDVTVSPDSVYQAVATLRRLLGDDSRQPTYIATVPRLGYRMVATVNPWIESFGTPAQPSPANLTAPTYGMRRRPSFTGSALRWVAGATLGVILLAFAVVFLAHGKPANPNHAPSAAISSPPPQGVESIAVLPFLDLTEGMKEEEFADGMTEELIGRLSKIPSLRVPSPTSSFYFKGKQIPVADIARSLGVAYILDGSVRKSGGRLRVAARLMRAENGYVVWSESYDRPFNDILMVQDDITGAVTKALRKSIEATPAH